MTHLLAGVCSVTFRERSIEEVARLAAAAGLATIEWGADVHVRPGDNVAAERAVAACAEHELAIGSYGSYLFAGGAGDPGVADVCATAVALGAPNIRIWTPFGTSAPEPIATAVRDAAATAAGHGLTLTIEFHGGTPNDTVEHALQLLELIDAPNVLTSWQPPYWEPEREPVTIDADRAVALAPRLGTVHVYEWTAADDRHPLADGRARWQAVLDALRAAPLVGADPLPCFLEFVAGDDPDQFARDAATLRELLSGE